jgi:hypothetical protein
MQPAQGLMEVAMLPAQNRVFARYTLEIADGSARAAE